MTRYRPADAGNPATRRTHDVSDGRLAALDLTVTVLLIVMALGPLSAYAILGG